LRLLNANARGSVLLLEWRQFSLLLPLAMDLGALEAMQDFPGPVSALLLGGEPSVVRTALNPTRALFFVSR
jgi:hypothetical protein